MGKEISITKEDLSRRLQEEPSDLFFAANALTEKLFFNEVFIRGIIELSNRCQKDCFYCALRKSHKINRYLMTEKEILSAALFAHEKRFGSIVLQAGENNSDEMVDFYISVIRLIKNKTNLGITLSLGEFSKEAYLEFFKAGAHRYLLRIETSSRQLYEKMHPKDHSFDKRLRCLSDLKTIGYQLGTGVLIGLPHQTYDDLADDLLFYKNLDVDMIGMGHYIPHVETPLSKQIDQIKIEDPFNVALKMVALCRLMLKDVNIAATTALDILNPSGREKALLCGANVVMPIITPLQYRKDYKLYDNSSLNYKDPLDNLKLLEKRFEKINRRIAFDTLGDPKHFFQRRLICP
jgi:biotin synthase